MQKLLLKHNNPRLTYTTFIFGFVVRTHFILIVILYIMNFTEAPTSKGDQSAVATELPVSHGAKESKDAGISSEKEVQTTPSTEVSS